MKRLNDSLTKVGLPLRFVLQLNHAARHLSIFLVHRLPVQQHIERRVEKENREIVGGLEVGNQGKHASEHLTFSRALRHGTAAIGAYDHVPRDIIAELGSQRFAGGGGRGGGGGGLRLFL